MMSKNSQGRLRFIRREKKLSIAHNWRNCAIERQRRTEFSRGELRWSCKSLLSNYAHLRAISLSRDRRSGEQSRDETRATQGACFGNSFALGAVGSHQNSSRAAFMTKYLHSVGRSLFRETIDFDWSPLLRVFCQALQLVMQQLAEIKWPANEAVNLCYRIDCE